MPRSLIAFTKQAKTAHLDIPILILPFNFLSPQSDNQDIDKLHNHSSDVDNNSNPEHHHSGLNADRDYISSPGYDTSSTAPASSPDLGDYNYESSVQDYKSRPAPSRVSGTNFTNFYGSSSTSSLSKDSTPERSLDHVPTTQSTVPLAKRPSLTKIENRLLNFEIKGSSQEEKVVSQAKKDLPKVDVLKRREMFEKESSLGTEKSENRLSTDFSKGASIRERLSHLEKRDDVKDASIKKINRMSGDFGSVKERLTTIEKPVAIVAEKKKTIEVPVVSIKDRLSSFHQQRPDENNTSSDESLINQFVSVDRDDSGILTGDFSSSVSSSHIQEVSIESVNLVQQLINELVINEPIAEISAAPIVVPDVVPQPIVRNEVHLPPTLSDIDDESIFNSPEPNSLEQESSVSPNTSIAVVSHNNNQTQKTHNGSASTNSYTKTTNFTNPPTQSILSVVSAYSVQVDNPSGVKTLASSSPVDSVNNAVAFNVANQSPKNSSKKFSGDGENVVYQSPKSLAKNKVNTFSQSPPKTIRLAYEDSPTKGAKSSVAQELQYIKVTESDVKPQDSTDTSVPCIDEGKSSNKLLENEQPIKIDVRSSTKLSPIETKRSAVPIYENVVFSQQPKIVDQKPTTIYNLTTNELIQVSRPIQSKTNDHVATGFLATTSSKLKQITADIRNSASPPPSVETSEAKNQRLKCQIVGVLEKNRSPSASVVPSPQPPPLPINEAPKTPMSPTPSTKSNGSASRNIFDFIKSNLLNETTQNLLEKSTFYVALSEHTARVTSFLNKEDSPESTASSSEVNRLLDEELDTLN